MATRAPEGVQGRAHGPGAPVITRSGEVDLDELRDEVEVMATTQVAAPPAPLTP